MGVMSTLVLGLIPLSQGISGLVIDAVDQQVPVIYATVGGLFAAFVVLASTSGEFRRYLATDYSS